jgi:TonB family protein
MGILGANSLSINKTQQPQITKPFRITYEDLPYTNANYFLTEIGGSVLVEFTIDENGEVVKPEITDTFDIKLNDAIIDRVMRIEFEPALQNGIPVRVRYKLPILFK